MMASPRIMLLIDGDNVSADIIEQAVSRLHAEYGVLHVRRAYGTAENAVKHQKLFRRLSIRPIVNLATGKNSTDIALAVDALDLVASERPDVVVIASSDSDFAPLVARIREKGCLVRGVGQKGKVGEETPLIYDDFIEFEHRRPRSRAAAEAEGAAAAPRKTPVRKAAASAAASPSKEAKAPAAPAAGDAAAAPARPARKTPARKVAAKTPAAAADEDVAAAAKADAPAPRKRAVRRPAAAPAEAAPALPTPPDKVARAFAALPQLAAGQRVDVQNAAAVLRRERVFSSADSWPKFFERYKEWFELSPPERPTHVQRRSPG